ncbi:MULTISPECIES: DUF3087 domain-containing protein [Alteromonadaceae]|uniref:DUF3087 domain-containing protein n=1 Tax=Brumicola blandensis TaxID=3075611 RepID=A0AAW8R2A3_9ALTE|nr:MULTISPECIES: DUF3087 domain-containing protein [unclassified Alteromonas]MDT0583392.1 DUF3087 domain-containing protein [Alteromonas sp. W409]MDT0629323.1 DUF3087 domain-containing protein [Alteromonas sp. W364]
MKLIQIDKARYRKHLNYVIITCIASLTAGSLGIAQSLIALFPDPSGSHFHWNLTGVIISAVVIGLVLNKIKNNHFMTEVTYVWQLKKVLNRINRKMMKLKPASEEGNVNAMICIHYSYAGSRLLWELDDNTIIMEQLALDQAALDGLASKYNVNLQAEDFEASMLDQF